MTDREGYGERECLNRWVISGLPAEVREAVDLITERRRCGERLVTFDKIIPMPALLKRMDVGWNVLPGGGEVSRWVIEWKFFGVEAIRALTAQECAEHNRLGRVRPDDWAWANWGVPDDADSQGVALERTDAGTTAGGESDVYVSFNTYCDPPKPVYEALCARFPSLRITASYFGDFAVGAGQLHEDEPSVADDPAPG